MIERSASIEDTKFPDFTTGAHNHTSEKNASTCDRSRPRNDCGWMLNQRKYAIRSIASYLAATEIISERQHQSDTRKVGSIREPTHDWIPSLDGIRGQGIVQIAEDLVLAGRFNSVNDDSRVP